MRFLHLADLHIGKTVNEFSMLADQRHALEQIVAFVSTNTEKIDAVLIAGDLYDKASPSAEAVSLVDWFLTQLAQAHVACFAIPGNHDSAERVGYASSLLAQNNIYLAGPYQGDMPRYRLEDEHGFVNFWLLPFVRPANVRPYFPDDDIGTSYTAALRAIIDHGDVDFSQRNVLLAHQFVSFGSAKPETSDSEIGSIGGVDEVSSEVFEGFDYVALGHIHKSQAISKGTVRYAGSLLKYSFSEARYKKAFPLVTISEKGNVKLDELTIEPLHDMREISGTLEQLTKPEVVSAAQASDYLHVTLTDEHPAIDALQRLRSVYPNIMLMDYQNALERAKREQSTLTRIDRAKFSPNELFKRFYEEQFGSPLSDMQESVFTSALSQCIENESLETSSKESTDATA